MKHLEIVCVDGKENCADLLTKALTRQDTEAHCRRLAVVSRPLEGRFLGGLDPDSSAPGSASSRGVALGSAACSLASARRLVLEPGAEGIRTWLFARLGRRDSGSHPPAHRCSALRILRRPFFGSAGPRNSRRSSHAHKLRARTHSPTSEGPRESWTPQNRPEPVSQGVDLIWTKAGTAGFDANNRHRGIKRCHLHRCASKSEHWEADSGLLRATPLRPSRLRARSEGLQ